MLILRDRDNFIVLSRIKIKTIHYLIKTVLSIKGNLLNKRENNTNTQQTTNTPHTHTHTHTHTHNGKNQNCQQG